MEDIQAQLKEFKERSKMIKKQIKQQTVGYIVAGLGLVAGLAWNEAIKAFIEYLFPLNRNTILAKFIYAFLITGVVVVITIYLNKLFQSKDKDKQDEEIRQ